VVAYLLLSFTCCGHCLYSVWFSLTVIVHCCGCHLSLWSVACLVSGIRVLLWCLLCVVSIFCCGRLNDSVTRVVWWPWHVSPLSVSTERWQDNNRGWWLFCSLSVCRRNSLWLWLWLLTADTVVTRRVWAQVSPLCCDTVNRPPWYCRRHRHRSWRKFPDQEGSTGEKA